MRRAFVLFPVLMAALLVSSADSTGQQKKKGKEKTAAAKPQTATDPATMRVMKGFKVELLYTVPRDTQGSWVNLCVDPKGRLITSDQYGPLYRITPPPIGGKPEETKVEVIKVFVDKDKKQPLGDAQGLLWAFDSLYVVVNSGRIKSGLYRVKDTDGDDMPDTAELLREFNNGGEHGPHAVIAHPDGKRITVVCGDATKLTKYDTTRVPPVWGEDHLLPRMPDGNGFMKGVLGPGGAIYNTDPEGKTWELFSVGYRNQFDAAYNQAGDLFTYDADMEWDMNTPWYRPTRVCLVTSGSEYGWRNGAGKYPPYYPDNLPGVVDIGPGSPTGICFGYGARFPAKYQQALFMCDWSYGKLYAVHLAPRGASYTGTFEEFLSGSPLPLTDVVVNARDGAMYFTIGGRKTQSGLYRVTYAGSEIPPPPFKTLSFTGGNGPIPEQDRKHAETFHAGPDPKAIEAVWSGLDSPDRFVRFASRVAIEHQPVAEWREKALAETRPSLATNALLALCRVSAPDPFHRKPSDPPADPALRGRIVEALNKIDFAGLDQQQKLEFIRVYHVLFNRFGKPTDAEREAVLRKFDPIFPTKNRYVDGELLNVLVYLEAPDAAANGVALINAAPTQEEQMEYVRALRVLAKGWTPDLRKQYFSWFLKAVNFRGGNSLRGFMKTMRDDATATLTPEEKKQFAPLLDEIARATPKSPADAYPPKPFVKKWSLDELAPKLEAAVKAGGRDFDRGRRLFAEARCFGCHRFDNDGSSFGPDLSQAAGRFSPRDLLESVIDPSKEISDQYAAVEIELTNGNKVIGRIVNLHDNVMHVNTDMLDPNKMINVKRDDVERMKPSKVSMMPEGLLDVLKEDEALDLMAYLLSRGDRGNVMFKK
jgi:putative heme-binding domain-containing protein